MSAIKNTIEKLLKNTKISGRYRQILELHKNNPEYAKLTYHNVDHVAAVLNLFEILRKLSGKQFDKAQLYAVELAIAFHDFNHTGHPDSHRDDQNWNNIIHAIAGFSDWATNQPNMPYQFESLVKDLIEASAYPHTPYTHVNIDPELLAMMRDADILWGMVPGNAEQCMLGMWAERRNVGLETEQIDILKVLTDQINFIQQYQPLSSAGRTFKNAMLVAASNAWALAALQYQRQIEAANIVNQMSDAEVLKLAAALKPAVRQQMVAEVEQSASPDEKNDDGRPS